MRPAPPTADLLAHVHLLIVGGSRAHGLHTAASDVDLRGVATFAEPGAPGCSAPDGPAPLRTTRADADRGVIDTPERLAPLAATLTGAERAVLASQPLEGAVHGLERYVELAADARPDVLDPLFCRKDEIRVCSAVGAHLRAARRHFVTCRARTSTLRYARAQLRRLRRHHRWLADPPPGPPRRADHGLPEQPSSPRPAALDDAEVARRETRWRAARADWRSFRSWRASRRDRPAASADRATREDRFGYDPHDAAHLVRLLRVARELLETGEVHVWRGDRDADELRAIHAGGWAWPAVEALASDALAALESCPAVVPPRPDPAALAALLRELSERALRAP